MKILEDAFVKLKDDVESITFVNGKVINNVGNEQSSRSFYAYSNPILMHKGDVLLINIYTNWQTNESKYAQIFLTNENGDYYYPLMIFQEPQKAWFIAKEDIYVTFNQVTHSKNDHHLYRVGAYTHLIEDETNERFYPKDKWLPIFRNMARAVDVKGTKYNKRVTFLYGGDVHGSNPNVYRLNKLANKYAEYIDDVMMLGDMVASRYADEQNDTYIYNQDGGFRNILQLIGNHDVYDHEGTQGTTKYDDKAYWATPQEKYTRYMANIGLWGVRQPSGAGTNEYYPCYYVKDYDLNGNGHSTISKLRMIVLDCMAYDDVQHDWFVSEINDAKTNGYAVLIASHIPPVGDVADANIIFDTAFNNIVIGIGNQLEWYKDASNRTPMDVIDQFIEGGGEFVCWIVGHKHVDQLYTLKSHPKQIVVTIGTAKGNIDQASSDTSRVLNTPYFDLLNLISIDTYSKYLTIVRVGADRDMWMRNKESVTIDYKNIKVVS